MAEDHIMLKNVRVSFPHLFVAPVINGEEGSCGAVLLLEPDHPGVAAVRRDIARVLAAKFQGRKLPSDKLCLRTGEDRRPEYEGYLALSANVKKGKRPHVISTDGRGIVSSDSECAIYPGCRVNAKVRLWGQDNKYGKRVNAELIAIQFAGDDEPLDDSYVSAEEAVSGFDPTHDYATADDDVGF